MRKEFHSIWFSFCEFNRIRRLRLYTLCPSLALALPTVCVSQRFRIVYLSRLCNRVMVLVVCRPPTALSIQRMPVVRRTFSSHSHGIVARIEQVFMIVCSAASTHAVVMHPYIYLLRVMVTATVRASSGNCLRPVRLKPRLTRQSADELPHLYDPNATRVTEVS